MFRRLAAPAAALALFAVGASSALAAHAPLARVAGTVDRLHSDDFRAEHDHTYLALTTDGPAYRLVLPKHLRLRVHSRVLVVARRVGHTLHVRSARLVGPPLTARALSASTASATGAHKVAVLMFNFTNDTKQPYTADQLRSAVFTGTTSANAYLTEASHGLLSLTGKLRSDGDVFGWYTIPYDTSSCQFSNWASAARSAAQAAGVDLSGYNHLIYYFPYESVCAWGGMADTPGTNVWINGGTSYRAFSHELGHNLGFFHASSIDCTDATGARVSLSASCIRNEYGDPFDVMGIGSYEYSNWHKAQLGWLAGAAQTITANGVYTLSPEELAAGTTLLRIPRGSTGDYLYLEYRQPYGTFDNFLGTSPIATGVTVRIAPDYGTFTQSLLVDATPGTTSFNDAPLPVGKTLVDPVSAVSITTVSAGLTATVSVSLNGSSPPAPTSDTVAPSTPASLAAQATATSVSLAWGAATDNVAVTGYRVYRDGSLLGSTSATSFADAAVAAGTTYSYSVAAYDAAGNVSAASSPVSVTIPSSSGGGGGGGADTTAPTAPTNVAAVAGSASAVTVSWAASVDDVGVTQYDVYRDGVKVGSTTTTGYTDAALVAGTYTYTVRALDAAGNVSAPSNGAIVTLSPVDSTPPSAPAWLQAQAVHGPGIVLSWAAATDNVAVSAYRVYRNGTLVGTTAATSFTDSHLSGSTAYAYYVVAVDTAGNASGASPNVSVTTRKK
jgi:chitodextrinase